MFGNFWAILLFSEEGLKKIPMFHLFNIFSPRNFKTMPWFFQLSEQTNGGFWTKFWNFLKKLQKEKWLPFFLEILWLILEPSKIILDFLIFSDFGRGGTFPCFSPCWQILYVLVDIYYSIIFIASTVLMEVIFLFL